MARSGRYDTFPAKVRELGPALYWPLGSNGVADLSGNGRKGRRVASPSRVPGPWPFHHSRATDLNGSTQYVSSLYADRTNLVSNPSFEVDTGLWTAGGTGLYGEGYRINPGTVMSRVTSQQRFGAGAMRVVTPGGTTLTGANYGPIDVAIGEPITVSIYVKGNAGGEQVQLIIGDGTVGPASSDVVTLTTAWQRLSVTLTPTATGQTGFAVRQNQVGYPAITYFLDGALVESGSSVGAYFDGSGYVDGAGNFVTPGTGEVRWTITAHVSPSQRGSLSSYKPWVVGASRSVVGWANRDTNSSVDAFFGTEQDFRVALVILGTGQDPDGTGRRVRFLNNGGSQVEWPLAWPGLSTWALFGLNYNDATREAELFIGGVSAGILTLPSAHNAFAGERFFMAGMDIDPSIGGNLFDGKLAHFAVFERLLTAAEHADLALAGSAEPTSFGALSTFTPIGGLDATLDGTVRVDPLGETLDLGDVVASGGMATRHPGAKGALRGTGLFVES